MNKAQAELLLKTALADTTVTFRDGQWEAIDALVNQNQKLLVVQRTGWGKSSVYFISAKIFRDRGMGPTIIISPLLALMRNQIDSARRLGINAVTINSSNTAEWKAVTQSILNDEVDCLLISPEKLANDSFIETVLQPISDRVGLMVIDEAHCISDWGHDFRPDYRRIVNIISNLPANTPVLGTTATANNRVVEDIQTQLGDIQIQRGPLIRDSLGLQTNILPDQASRLAWLAQTIPQIQETGIIYVLTTRDADQVADWLKQNDINALAYYGKVTSPDFISESGKRDNNAYRQYLEEMLLRNDLDVLVATNALGMGYDKSDLGFVFHYQMPGSIVTYYQQVGRAGRGIDNAIGVLLSGKEDQSIHDSFRDSAFPSEYKVNEILVALTNSDGLSEPQLEEKTNLSNSQIKLVLKLLRAENPAPVIKIGSQWRRTAIPFIMDRKRISHLTQQREQEWQEIKNYTEERGCLMNFLQHSLNDHVLAPCGKCENCLKKELVSIVLDNRLIHQAATFIKEAENFIEPRKVIAKHQLAFPEYKFPRELDGLVAEQGRALSKWLDSGWGQLVEDCKLNDHFTDEIVEATAEMIEQRWESIPKPTWVCCVPSLKQVNLVPNFASRLANRLEVPFHNIVKKVKDTERQKYQRNSFHQCKNLDGAFFIEEPLPEGPVLLIDDVINSGWTFTIIAALLRRAGSGPVVPVALAST
jgi:ATP-dependent DNA helicase RecQ